LTGAFLPWLGGSLEQMRCNPSAHSVVILVISEGANFVHNINKKYHLILSV
jgi:hypothetical protein